MPKSIGAYPIAVLPIVVLIALACALFAGASTAFADVIFVGDSRTCGMYDSVYGGIDEEVAEAIPERGELWRAKGGTGCDWFEVTGVPYADKHVSAGDDVIVLMGVNDCGDASRYAEILNRKASEWKARGARTFFVSANPVDDAAAAASGFPHTNESVLDFNGDIRRMLGPDVSYIDTYSQIEQSCRMVDGLHYDAPTYMKIYEIIYATIGKTPTPTNASQLPKDDAVMEPEPSPAVIVDDSPEKDTIPWKWVTVALAAGILLGTLFGFAIGTASRRKTNKLLGELVESMRMFEGTSNPEESADGDQKQSDDVSQEEPLADVPGEEETDEPAGEPEAADAPVEGEPSEDTGLPVLDGSREYSRPDGIDEIAARTARLGQVVEELAKQTDGAVAEGDAQPEL